jgi:hypothetical protein
MNLEKLKEYAINAATNAGKFLNSNKFQKKEIISARRSRYKARDR